MTSPNTIIADMQAEIDALRKERDELIVQLSKAINLYETYGLIAGSNQCGKWINDSRQAIASVKGGS